MTSGGHRYATWFERHAGWTLLIVVLSAIVILDVLSAQAYKAVFGYPWADRKVYEIGKAEEKQKRVHQFFHVRSNVYDHDLAKSKSIENVIWGPHRYRVYTNSLGFRDRSPREVPLISDQFRLVLMGDSFTQGVGLDFDQTFAGIVGEALGKKGVEVLDAGVGSYSPIIYWRKTKYLLETAGLKFDEMAVFLDISDVEDEARFYHLDDRGNVALNKDQPGHGAKPVAAQSKRSGSMNYVKEKVRDNTVFLYSLLKGVRSLLPGSSGGAKEKEGINLDRSLWTVDDALYRAYGEIGIERMKLYMNRLLVLLRSHGIRLLIVVYPWPDQIVREDLDSIHVKIWRDWSEANHVPFLNFFPMFIKKGSTLSEKKRVLDQYFFKGDVHWNAEGHRLIGRGFLEFYEKNHGRATGSTDRGSSPVRYHPRETRSNGLTPKE
jgi:lysophospholipase L1-like esterase